MKLLVLENFIKANMKMIFLYVGLLFALLFIGGLTRNVTIVNGFVLLLCLSICVFCFMFLFLNKALFLINGKLYNGLVLFEFVVLKKEINTDVYVLGNVERLDKSSDSWLWFAPILSLLKNFDRFSVVLLNEDKSNSARLMNLTEVEQVNKAIEFLHSNTNIVFSKKKYINH